mmetsp:Transcript_22499/g.26063  ORF Transcript_22499/g.26063 Transcript_22499/m.26063 type:complete len:139 (+) Transcript_22499:92-508(+)
MVSGTLTAPYEGYSLLRKRTETFNRGSFDTVTATWCTNRSFVGNDIVLMILQPAGEMRSKQLVCGTSSTVALKATDSTAQWEMQHKRLVSIKRSNHSVVRRRRPHHIATAPKRCPWCREGWLNGAQHDRVHAKDEQRR